MPEPDDTKDAEPATWPTSTARERLQSLVTTILTNIANNPNPNPKRPSLQECIENPELILRIGPEPETKPDKDAFIPSQQVVAGV